MQTARPARDVVPQSRPTTVRPSARAASHLTTRVTSPRSHRPARRPPSGRGMLPLASAVAAIGAILFVGIWFAGRRERQRADAVDHYNRGNGLRGEGKLEEAMAAWREAIRIKPDIAEAHSNLGIALADQGKLNEAVAEFRTAIRINPDDAEAHFNLGIALKAQGKLDETIAAYRTAIRLKPHYPDAYVDLGIALSDQGKPEEAVAAYRTAIRLKPDSAEAHHNLGWGLRDQGQLEEAIAEFRETIQLKPDLAEARYSLGNALAAQGKVEDAIAEYRAAIRLKPDHAEARHNLGVALKAQGKLVEGIAEYRAAPRTVPKTSAVPQTGKDVVVYQFEPGWKAGHEQEIPGRYSIRELIREGDDIENWKELFTIEEFRRQDHRVSPEALLRDTQLVREKKCPGATKWNVISQDDKSILYEWQARPCLGWPDQHEIARIIYGKHNVFQLRYTVKMYQMPAKRRAEMIKRLSEASCKSSESA